MNDIEQMLEQLKPRDVRPELRPRVLATVDAGLRPDTPWLHRATMGVAAAILLGAALNIWAAHAADRRMAGLFGDSPPPTETTRRVYAEYNAVLRELLIAMQSPSYDPIERRVKPPTATPSKKDDRGAMFDGFSLRPPVACLT